MNAVIYARYSSDNQREESIEGQLRECKDYADRNGITILTSYIDRALSAKTDNRPQFQKMIHDSEKGMFDIVLVWKLDRFARNRYDSARYKAALKKHGVKVVSAKENIAEDSTGILLESLIEGYAEYYSVELSEKVKRGHKENALKGVNNGGTTPLGYILHDKHLQVDPRTAPLVIEIFNRYSDGETLRAIANSFNIRGIKTNKGKPFTANSFHSLLKNRKYLGEYRYQDTVITNGVPALISPELFEKVQTRLNKNKRSPARAKASESYLLSTKLFCGECGRLMDGESGTSHTGKKYKYYKCLGNKRRLGCRKKSIQKDWIENLVVQKVIETVFDDSVISSIADIVLEYQNAENPTLPALRKQLAETEKGIENILNAIQQGIFTPSTKQRLDELESAKEKLNVSIMQEELQSPRLTREQVLYWLKRFRTVDITQEKQRQKLIDSFVNSIYVFDNKLVLTFNYRDGTETIPLSEVKGSDLLDDGSPVKPH